MALDSALDPATSGFLLSSAIALLVAIVCVLLFSALRNKHQNVYEFRRLIHQWKQYDDFNEKRVGVPEVVPRREFFAWISAALAGDEDEIVREISLDAAMYLRYLRSMFLSFSIVALIGVVFLMPVYGTGTMKNAPPPRPVNGTAVPDNRIRGLRVVSLANVESGDPRLWVVFIMELLSTLVFIYFMYKDFARFAELRRKNLTEENPKNYAVALYDVPREKNHGEEEYTAEKLKEDIIRRFNVIVPNQIADVIIVRNNKQARKLLAKYEKAIANRELCEWKAANNDNESRPQHRAGCCGALRCWQKKVDSIEFWEAEQTRLGSEVVESSKNATIAPCAVIVFKNMRAASLLIQANMADDATQWNVEKMPEPKAINWDAFSIPNYQAEIRRIGVLVFNIALTLFWTIPAFGIASLINLQALAENKALRFLQPLITANPALTGLLQGLLPTIILAVIVALIPVVMRLVVRLERLHDDHIVDRKTRDYFYFFTIYGSFFCIVLGSSILQELAGIIKSPFTLFEKLGSSIPGNGIFFATFIVIQTGVGVSVDLFNPLRLILVWLFKKMAKTERQLRKAQANGCEPNLFKRYGAVMLVAFMGIMYTPLAPIVPVCAVIFFGYNYLVSRYNMRYNLYAESDGAGESYPGAFWGTLIALLLRHGVVIVLVGFKSGKAIAPFCIIPLVISIAFALETGRRFRRVSMFGSLHDHFSKSTEVDELPKSYIEEFEQPGVKLEKYQNLNGVVDPGDYHDDCRDICDGPKKTVEGAQGEGTVNEV